MVCLKAYSVATSIIHKGCSVCFMNRVITRLIVFFRKCRTRCMPNSSCVSCSSAGIKPTGAGFIYARRLLSIVDCVQRVCSILVSAGSGHGRRVYDTTAMPTSCTPVARVSFWFARKAKRVYLTPRRRMVLHMCN